MEKAIEIQNLWKCYERKIEGKTESLEVLADLNLSVYPTEFVTIIGPNGCGKTTLLNIINGLQYPTRGAVRVMGSQKSEETPTGFVFQNYSESLFPWRNNTSNIAFPLELRGVPVRERKQKVQELCDELGLPLNLDAYPYQMSSGQQQMLTIARSLIDGSRIVLMDEPFASLDYHNKIMVQQHLLDVWKRKKMTILLVSHDIEEAIYLADRIVLLSKRPARVLKS